MLLQVAVFWCFVRGRGGWLSLSLATAADVPASCVQRGLDPFPFSSCRRHFRCCGRPLPHAVPLPLLRRLTVRLPKRQLVCALPTYHPRRLCRRSLLHARAAVTSAFESTARSGEHLLLVADWGSWGCGIAHGGAVVSAILCAHSAPIWSPLSPSPCGSRRCLLCSCTSVAISFCCLGPCA